MSEPDEKDVTKPEPMTDEELDELEWQLFLEHASIYAT